VKGIGKREEPVVAPVEVDLQMTLRQLRDQPEFEAIVAELRRYRWARDAAAAAAQQAARESAAKLVAQNEEARTRRPADAEPFGTGQRG
jgi:hypothetical protein